MLDVAYRMQDTRKRIKDKEKGCHNSFHPNVHPSTNQDPAWAFLYKLYEKKCLYIEHV